MQKVKVDEMKVKVKQKQINRNAALYFKSESR